MSRPIAIDLTFARAYSGLAYNHRDRSPAHSTSCAKCLIIRITARAGYR
jgi:hypothetical protein